MTRARPVFTDIFSGIIFVMVYFTDISEWLSQNKHNRLKLYFVPSQTITSHLIG